MNSKYTNRKTQGSSDMLLTEYDEAFHIACEKKISYEEGRAESQKELEKAHLAATEAQKRAEEALEQNKKYEKILAELGVLPQSIP